MTDALPPLPTYPANDLFETGFEPHLTLPGFFPGAGGYFHGHRAGQRRLFFFGTDFGPLAYQRQLPTTNGEPESVTTLRQLRAILERSGLRLEHCFLTNALLCMRKGASATSRFPVWRRCPDYVSACAQWHRRVIADCKPEGVVLMGRPHLDHFGRLLFPELDERWRGIRTIRRLYAMQREAVTRPDPSSGGCGPFPKYAMQREAVTRPDGLNVLLMPHPSFWHAQSEDIRKRVVGHLARWAVGLSAHGY